jgi:hypothetical protein
MSRPHLVFGSSKDLLRPFWRVWTYDANKREVLPLAHYNDKTKSDAAAFDLAHAAGSFEKPSVSDDILSGKDSEATPLYSKIAGMLATLAEDAIQTSEVPEETKSAVTVRHTPDDSIYVVRVAGTV